MSDCFWKRWRSEYLRGLQMRQKWHSMRRNLVVGDLVLVAEESAHRGKWPLGRIERVLTRSDGLVRCADVRTSAGVVTRPIVKLCLLEQYSRAPQ